MNMEKKLANKEKEKCIFLSSEAAVLFLKMFIFRWGEGKRK